MDIEGCGLVPDGAAMRDKPARILLRGGPGGDHSSFKPMVLDQRPDVSAAVIRDGVVSPRARQRLIRNSAD